MIANNFRILLVVIFSSFFTKIPPPPAIDKLKDFDIIIQAYLSRILNKVPSVILT